MLSSIWATVDYDGRALPFARYRDPPPAPSYPDPLGPLCSLGLSVPTVNITAVPPSAEPGVSH